MMLLLAFMLSLACCLLLSSRFSPLRALSIPNARSLHKVATPSTGGVGILLSVLLVWLLILDWNIVDTILANITIAALLVAVVSFMDDRQGISIGLRLIVHALAAGLLVSSGLILFDGWIGLVFTWFAIMWMLNLYNFMDGVDGLSGGMTLFGFGFIACAGWLQGASEYGMFASAVAASALGFLCVNFPPSKIFMGDVGAVTIGLLVSAFSLWGMREELFTWWFPVLVFSPFIVDSTVTLIRRIFNRERVFQAHRTHYYQRLVRLGWGHKKTVLVEYMLMALAGCSALIALKFDSVFVTMVVLLAWSCIYVLIVLLINRFESDVLE